LEASATILWVLILLVALALAFDFMNGFHDAANAIATIVSTGVLKPGQAVVWAATFNFVALFVFGLSVAATISKGMIQPNVVDYHVIFGALVGAIAWNVITWYFGIPSSSSHALLGGMIGAAVAKAGTSSLIAAGILKTVAFILVAPLLGFALAALLMVIVSWTCRQMVSARPTCLLRALQLRTRQQRCAKDAWHYLVIADYCRIRH
jgi:inorganic phosphate transporter, PiT family